MRLILFILFFCTANVLLGQEFPPKKYQSYDFSKIEAKISDTDKYKLIKRCMYSDYLPTQYPPQISADGEFANYHVLDVNADGLLDIMYNNKVPDGIEKTISVIYINEKDSLRPVIKMLGNFTKIHIENNQLKSFQLIDFPCCLNPTYWIKNYEYRNATNCYVPQNGTHERYKYSYGDLNDPRFCVSSNGEYKYFVETEFPDTSTIIDTLAVAKKTFLTVKPKKATNTNLDLYDRTDFYYGNKAIYELPVGKHCYVISEKKDEKGRIFCFVMISEANDAISSNFVYGWVAKNNLKK